MSNNLSGAIPFGKAFNPKGGPHVLPFSRAQGYVEVNEGRLSTFMVGSRRYISYAAIDAYIREREAEELLRESLERRSRNAEAAQPSG